MSERYEKTIKLRPTMYAFYYSFFREIAIEHGYALSLHGSMQRDFDLIAVAWIEKPKPYLDMLKKMAKKVGFYLDDDELERMKAIKPHGRIAFSLNLGDGGGYLDISIIPPNRANES